METTNNAGSATGIDLDQLEQYWKRAHADRQLPCTDPATILAPIALARATPAQTDDSSAEFLAKRLGRVAKAAGVTMPDGDYEFIAGVAPAILGAIARVLEKRATPAQNGEQAEIVGYYQKGELGNVYAHKSFGPNWLPAYSKPLAPTAATQPERADGLPPLPELESLADLEYVLKTPDDWDEDYRNTWQQLQLEACHKRRWRAYAHQLRAALAIPASTAASEQQAGADERGYSRGYRVGLLSAASGVRSLFINHVHHKGVDDLLSRCSALADRLFAEADLPAATLPSVSEDERAQVRDAVSQALTGVYYCGRVWSAWQVGAMSEDDFTPAQEVDEVLDEITERALAALTHRAAPAVSEIRTIIERVVEGAETWKNNPGGWSGTVPQLKRALDLLAAAPDIAAPAVDQQAGAACGTCDGSGIVGFPPDRYEHCPECVPPAATTASAPAPSRDAAPLVKTWQERVAEKYSSIPFNKLAPWAKLAVANTEIADLRAALAQQSAAQGDEIAVCGCGHDMLTCVATSCDKGITLVRAAQAQAGDDARDAARYRFLRDNNHAPAPFIAQYGPEMAGDANAVPNWLTTGADAAIDAAMAAPATSGGKA